MEMLDQILTLSNIIFCLAIWILVWMQRKFISMTWKKAETSKWYREILLPLGPLGTGGILAGLVSTYPYPEGFTSLGARVIFGVVCGLLSAHVYKMVKGFINKKKEEADSGEGQDLIKFE